MATKTTKTKTTTTKATREQIPGVTELGAQKRPLTGAAKTAAEAKAARLAALALEAQPEPEAEPELQPEPEATPEAQPEPEPQAEPEVEAAPDVEAALEGVDERYRAELRLRASAWMNGGKPPKTQAKLLALVAKWVAKVEAAEAKEAAAEEARKAKVEAAKGGDLNALQEVITEGLARPREPHITTSRDAQEWHSRVRKAGQELRAQLLTEVCNAVDGVKGAPTPTEVRRNGLLTPNLNAAMSRLEAGEALDEAALKAALVEAGKADAVEIRRHIEAETEFRLSLGVKIERLQREALRELLKAVPGTAGQLRNGLIQAMTGKLRNGLSSTALAELASNKKLLARLTEILEGKLEEAKAVPKTQPQPEPQPEPEAAPKTQPEPQPKAEAAETVANDEERVAPHNTPEKGGEEVAVSSHEETPAVEETVITEPQPEVQPEAQPEVQPEPQPEVQAEVKISLAQRLEAFFARQSEKVKAKAEEFGGWVRSKEPKKPAPRALRREAQSILEALLKQQPLMRQSGEGALFLLDMEKKDAFSKAVLEGFGAYGPARKAAGKAVKFETNRELLWTFKLVFEFWSKRTGQPISWDGIWQAFREVSDLPGVNKPWLEEMTRPIFDRVQAETWDADEMRVVEAIRSAKKVERKLVLNAKDGSYVAYYSYHTVLLVAKGLFGFAGWTTLPFRALIQLTGGAAWAALSAKKGERKAAAKKAVKAAWEKIQGFAWVTPKAVLSRVWTKISSVFKKKTEAQTAAKEAKVALETKGVWGRALTALKGMFTSVSEVSHKLRDEGKADKAKPIGAAVGGAVAGTAAVLLGAGVLVTAAVVVAGAAIGWFAKKAATSTWGWLKGVFSKNAETAPAASA